MLGRLPVRTAHHAQTKSTLPRLSHVVTRLVERGYVERVPCPEDKRATNAHLTAAEGGDAIADVLFGPDGGCPHPPPRRRHHLRDNRPARGRYR